MEGSILAGAEGKWHRMPQSADVRLSVPEMNIPAEKTIADGSVATDTGNEIPSTGPNNYQPSILETGASEGCDFVRRHQEPDGQPPNDTHRQHWLALLFGQAIALVAASMNASSYSLVYDFGLQTQLFQLFWVYLFLSCHLFLRSNTPITGESDAEGQQQINGEATFFSYSLPCFSQKIQLRIPWWKYFMISILDVVPNFLILFSYRFTSLTSTTILGSLTVPSTMLFTRVILSKVFHLHHYVGVVFCVFGGVMTIYMDSTDKATSPTGKSEAYGDALAVIAALMYGLGDAVAEYTVKNLDRFEYLGMLGFFGSIITGLTFPFIELNALEGYFAGADADKTQQVVALYLWSIISVILYYVLETRFLVSSDATLLNLSMQTVNIWAVVFTMTRYHGRGVSPLFWVALLLVCTGVFVYEMGWDYCCRLGNVLSCRCRGRRRLSDVEIIEATPACIDYQAVSLTYS